jgi:YVTN family beta-propeller protein
MNLIKHALPLVIFTVFLSCEKSDTSSKPEGYSHGVYIVNEGSFQQSNGSISYFDPSRSLIVNGIFEAANNRPLGDVVQSISIANDTTAYIAVNGSGKIEIVRVKDFKTIAPPIPIVYPRYLMQVSGDKGYLTAGSIQGWIYVISLAQHKVIDSLQVGFGPETMVKVNDQAFVANSGGWGLDSTISVIDINTDQVTKTFQVGKVPLDLSVDSENNVWVYCKGYAEINYDPYYIISETDALLQKIDRETGNIIWQQAVGKAGDYTATPPKMAISGNGSRLFYLRPDGVYAVSTNAPVLSATPLIKGSFYGIEVNPDDDNIYVFESPSFTGNGSLKIFDPEGNPVAQGTVGIAPNGAVFNQ